MKEKKKCKKCNLLIDADMTQCPYCGYDQTENPIDTSYEENYQEIPQEKVTVEAITFHRANGAFSLRNKRHLILILLAIFGLGLIATTVGLIVQAAGVTDANTVNSLTTLIAYPIFLVVLLISLWEDFIPVSKTLLNWRGYIYGLGFAALLVGFNYLYGYLISFANAGANINQEAVESTIGLYPVGSFIVLAFVGPICEELMYRLGVYGFLRKKNLWLALIVSSIIFGLIHFNIGSADKETLINELLNLPSYIISGAILCAAYEFGGLGASLEAHIANNLIAVILVFAGV